MVDEKISRSNLQNKGTCLSLHFCKQKLVTPPAMAAIYLLLSILAAFAGLVILCLLRRVPLVLASLLVHGSSAAESK